MKSKAKSFSEIEVFKFLDRLRESGKTNMVAASPYVQEEYGIGQRLANILLAKWMATFSERHPEFTAEVSVEEGFGDDNQATRHINVEWRQE